jgi:2-methylcitrate dehydratase PrpD
MTAPLSAVSPFARNTVVASIVDATRSPFLSDLSDALIGKVKTCLFDLIGCALEARDLPWSRQAVQIAQLSGVTHGAAIIGCPEQSSLGDAAFANGVMGHGLVREDMHSASISHLGIVIIPTLLALVQYKKITGRQFIQAAVLGYEVGAQIGKVVMDAQLARIHRPTGITGPIGASAAAGYLLGLSDAQMASAIGLSANTTSGFNQWAHTGGSEMFFHPGFAARNAVTAALLAEQGAFSSPDAIDGMAGLFASLHKPQAGIKFEMFSGLPEILSVYHKPVPACNFAQTATQAALRISLEHALVPQEIAAIRIRVPHSAAVYPGCDFSGTFENILQAKMSIQFNVAAALLNAGVTENNFSALNNQELTRLLNLTTLEEDSLMTQSYPEKQGGEVFVTLNNNAVQHVRLDNVVNASFGAVQARFKEACVARLGQIRADVLEAFILNIENTQDAGLIGALIQSE